MIVISNVERSQLKFFRPKGHVEDSLQVIDTFWYVLLSELIRISESLRVKN